MATLLSDRALRLAMATFLQNCSVRERGCDETVVAVSCDLLRGDCDEVGKMEELHVGDRGPGGDGDWKLHLLHAASRDG